MNKHLKEFLEMGLEDAKECFRYRFRNNSTHGECFRCSLKNLCSPSDCMPTLAAIQVALDADQAGGGGEDE